MKRILVVEDDPFEVELLIIAFKENNLAQYVTVVNNGAEALSYLFHKNEYASLSEGNPIFILLDLNMPRVDGFTVLEKLKLNKILRDIPVIILTSSQEPSDVERCYKLGANAYVIKPVHYKEFQKAISSISEFWAFVNKPSPNICIDLTNGST